LHALGVVTDLWLSRLIEDQTKTKLLHGSSAGKMEYRSTTTAASGAAPSYSKSNVNPDGMTPSIVPNSDTHKNAAVELRQQTTPTVRRTVPTGSGTMAQASGALSPNTQHHSNTNPLTKPSMGVVNAERSGTNKEAGVALRQQPTEPVRVTVPTGSGTLTQVRGAFSPNTQHRSRSSPVSKPPLDASIAEHRQLLLAWSEAKDSASTSEPLSEMQANEKVLQEVMKQLQAEINQRKAGVSMQDAKIKALQDKVSADEAKIHQLRMDNSTCRHTVNSMAQPGTYGPTRSNPQGGQPRSSRSRPRLPQSTQQDMYEHHLHMHQAHEEKLCVQHTIGRSAHDGVAAGTAADNLQQSMSTLPPEVLRTIVNAEQAGHRYDTQLNGANPDGVRTPVPYCVQNAGSKTALRLRNWLLLVEDEWILAEDRIAIVHFLDVSITKLNEYYAVAGTEEISELYRIYHAPAMPNTHCCAFNIVSTCRCLAALSHKLSQWDTTRIHGTRLARLEMLSRVSQVWCDATRPIITRARESAKPAFHTCGPHIYITDLEALECWISMSPFAMADLAYLNVYYQCCSMLTRWCQCAGTNMPKAMTLAEMQQEILRAKSLEAHSLKSAVQQHYERYTPLVPYQVSQGPRNNTNSSESQDIEHQPGPHTCICCQALFTSSRLLEEHKLTCSIVDYYYQWITTSYNPTSVPWCSPRPEVGESQQNAALAPLPPVPAMPASAAPDTADLEIIQCMICMEPPQTSVLCCTICNVEFCSVCVTMTFYTASYKIGYRCPHCMGEGISLVCKIRQLGRIRDLQQAQVPPDRRRATEERVAHNELQTIQATMSNAARAEASGLPDAIAAAMQSIQYTPRAEVPEPGAEAEQDRAPEAGLLQQAAVAQHTHSAEAGGRNGSDQVCYSLMIEMFPNSNPATIRSLCENPQMADNEAVVERLLELEAAADVAAVFCPGPASASPPWQQPPAVIPPASQQPVDTWVCPNCTFINTLEDLTCDICGIDRPNTTYRQVAIPAQNEGQIDNSTAAGRMAARAMLPLDQPTSRTCHSCGDRFSRRTTATGQVWTCRCSDGERMQGSQTSIKATGRRLRVWRWPGHGIRNRPCL
jgi:hypothetical protein